MEDIILSGSQKEILAASRKEISKLFILKVLSAMRKPVVNTSGTNFNTATDVHICRDSVPGPAGRAMSQVCRWHMRTRLYWSLIIHPIPLCMVLYPVAFDANGTESSLPKKWAS